MGRMAVALAAPLPLPCGAVLPNRLAKAPMTEGLADARDDATPALARLYGRWADGGAGLLVTGNAMVDRRYLERAGNVVVDRDSDVAALRAWATAAGRSGGHAWVQLSHPGRQSTRFHTARPVAPSAVRLPVAGMFARPRALEEGEIHEAIAAFARAAAVVQRAGFTGVQVHGAHGYLVSQFLSPRTNRRRDGWGGPLPHRARFLLEVVQAVRGAVGPAFPVAVKLNASDFQRGGFEPEDAVTVARWLAAERVDLIEVSGGTYERLAFAGHDGRAAATRAREAYFLEHAAALRRAAAGVPLMVSGGFRTPAAMAAALAAADLDVVGIGRPFCVDPGFPLRLLAGDGAPLPAPERAFARGRGPWSPSSRSATVRALHAQAATAWCYAQQYRLAAGAEPDVRRRPAAELVRHLAREASAGTARRLRRARGRRGARQAAGT
jgi:2,4-dienoyl-CoA reductase-like NADH-dependent reductase (Old Yellow Enzyme family)